MELSALVGMSSCGSLRRDVDGDLAIHAGKAAIGVGEIDLHAKCARARIEGAGGAGDGPDEGTRGIIDDVERGGLA